MPDSKQERRPIILVVDDQEMNRDLVSKMLEAEHDVLTASSGEMALEVAATAEPKPDLILLDISMPGISGLETCKRLKQDPLTRAIAVIFLTGRIQARNEAAGLAAGANDYVTKPLSPPVLLARIKTQLLLQDRNRGLEREVQKRTAELENTRREVIRRLGRAIEHRDNETGEHIIRMSRYCAEIASAYGCPTDYSERLLEASPMHDIGKIGIPDSILLKSGPLDESEWALMRTHPTVGAKIIGQHDTNLLKMAHNVALDHHEKWDGTGYPNNKKETGISLEGRIAALADMFDALLSKRPYKPAWPEDKAVAEIKSLASIHFDPDLVDAFEKAVPKILAIHRGVPEPEVEEGTLGGRVAGRKTSPSNQPSPN